MTRRLALTGLAVLAALAGYAPTADAAKDDLTLISHAFDAPLVRSNGISTNPVVSADGRYVAFVSRASNLVPGDSNAKQDVFRTDRVTGETVLVSRASGPGGALGDDDSGDFISPGSVDISANGRFVAFLSNADNLVPDATDSIRNVYVRDLQTETTFLAHRNDDGDAAIGGGGDGTGVGNEISISGDGHEVAFSSGAPNLLASSPSLSNVFVRDIFAGTTTLVSVQPGTNDPATERSLNASMSADGRYVAFVAFSPEHGGIFDPSESDYEPVAAIRDMTNQSVTVASIRPDGQTRAWGGRLSDDGSKLGFMGPNGYEVYLRDLAAGTTQLVSRADGPTGAPTDEFSEFALNADGRFVVFRTQDPDTSSVDDDTGDGDDVFVRDVAANRTYFVSRAAGPAGVADDGAYTFGVGVDASGRYVAFDSDATNLSDLDYEDAKVPFDHDVFVRELEPDVPPVPPVSDLLAPVLSAVGMTNRRFRVGKAPTPLVAAKRRRAPKGTAFALTLSEQATVRISISRKLRGIRIRTKTGARRCVAAGRRPVRRKLRCPIYRSKGVLIRKKQGPGKVTIAFSGRMGAKALAPGLYHAQVGATDPAGNRTVQRTTLAFRVVK